MKKITTALAAGSIAAALLASAPPATAAQAGSVYSCVKKEAGAKAAARYKAGKPTAADKKVIKACKSTGLVIFGG